MRSGQTTSRALCEAYLARIATMNPRLNAILLKDCAAAAQTHAWAIEEIHAPPNHGLLAFTRCKTRISDHSSRIYISTGIHGDEPAGPLAVRQLLQENRWPGQVDVWLCPCLNPRGFELNRRENAEGIDLNRDYRHLEAAEVRAHIAWLQPQPDFDLTLCLHEDWEAHGFYLYELNPQHRPSYSRKMIDTVTKVCPIDPSPEIEGRAAQGGIINPDISPDSRPQWPEAFYLLQNKTKQSYTLEAPSDFPLATRIAALVTAVRAAMDGM